MLLSSTDAARHLGISLNRVRQLIAAGRLPARQIGRRAAGYPCRAGVSRRRLVIGGVCDVTVDVRAWPPFPLDVCQNWPRLPDATAPRAHHLAWDAWTSWRHWGGTVDGFMDEFAYARYVLDKGLARLRDCYGDQMCDPHTRLRRHAIILGDTIAALLPANLPVLRCAAEDLKTGRRLERGWATLIDDSVSLATTVRTREDWKNWREETIVANTPMWQIALALYTTAVRVLEDRDAGFSNTSLAHCVAHPTNEEETNVPTTP